MVDLDINIQNNLAKRNNVTLMWIPRHGCVKGNTLRIKTTMIGAKSIISMSESFVEN